MTSVVRGEPQGPSGADAAAPAPRPVSYYSPQLDGLRFLAALAVYFHHAPALGFMGPLKTYGWAGVDLFLVISAYLLTRLMMLEYRETGQIALKSFFVRRALRIWPLYFGYVTSITIVAVAGHKVAADAGLYWWMSHLSFSNNIMAAVKGYSIVPFTGHLWTISLEEQAYLVMPFVLAGCLAARPSTRTIVVAAACIAAVLVAARASLVMAGVQHPFIWVLPLRADSIVFGAVAALSGIIPEKSRAGLIFLLGSAGLVSVGLFPSIAVGGVYQTMGYTVVALSCAVVVIATQAPGMALNGFLGSRPMRHLGKVSFGFYVFHPLMLYAAEKALTLFGLADALAVFLLGLALTIGVASLSYTVYEAPFLKLKRRFTVVRSRAV